MCIQTKMVEGTLKGIRAQEKDLTQATDYDLAKTLAEIKAITEELDVAKARATKELLERGYNGNIKFPELELKVYLAEGREVSKINSFEFMIEMKKAELDHLIPQCVSVVKSKTEVLENKIVSEIVTKATEKEKGEDTIAVRKMSKTEMKEAL